MVFSCREFIKLNFLELEDHDMSRNWEKKNKDVFGLFEIRDVMCRLEDHDRVECSHLHEFQVSS